jgi:hypothetical protein
MRRTNALHLWTRLPIDFVQWLARRVLVLWALSRVVIWGLVLAGHQFDGASASQLVPSLRASVSVIVLVGLLSFIDIARRNERLFLANFGLGQRHVIGGAMVIAAIAEGVLSLVVELAGI